MGAWRRDCLAAEAERDALRAENERLREMVKEAWRVGSELQSERDHWKRVCEETEDRAAGWRRLETVADRIVADYDRADSNRGWLSCVSYHDVRCNSARGLGGGCNCYGDDLRAAIDAARKGAADAE